LVHKCGGGGWGVGDEEEKDTPTEVGPTGTNIHHRWAFTFLPEDRQRFCPHYGVTQFVCLRTDRQNDSKRDMLQSESSGILARTVHHTLIIAYPCVSSLKVKNLS